MHFWLSLLIMVDFVLQNLKLVNILLRCTMSWVASIKTMYSPSVVKSAIVACLLVQQSKGEPFILCNILKVNLLVFLSQAKSVCAYEVFHLHIYGTMYNRNSFDVIKNTLKQNWDPWMLKLYSGILEYRWAKKLLEMPPCKLLPWSCGWWHQISEPLSPMEARLR